jgi:undecaprenyl-diphosphatase
VDLGTLAAVVAYFRRDLSAMLIVTFAGGGGDARLAWQLVVASIPLGLVGLFLQDIVETVLRTPLVIALASAGFGVLLYFADRYGCGEQDERRLGWTAALAISLALVIYRILLGILILVILI